MFVTLLRQSPEGSIQEAIPQSFVNDAMIDLLTIPAQFLTPDWNDWSFWWDYSELSQRQIACI